MRHRARASALRFTEAEFSKKWNTNLERLTTMEVERRTLKGFVALGGGVYTAGSIFFSLLWFVRARTGEWKAPNMPHQF
jgi:hypothetical protein